MRSPSPSRDRPLDQIPSESSSRDAFDADRAAWEEQFAPAIDTLKDAHAKVVEQLARDVDWRGPPRLTTDAAAFLKPTRLAIGEPSERVTRAGELTVALTALPPLLTRLLTIAHRLRVLGDESVAHSREGSSRLKAALALFDEAWWTIRTARSTSDLDVARTTAELDRARGLLDDVMIEHKEAEKLRSNFAIGPSSINLDAAGEVLSKLLENLPGLSSKAALAPTIGTGLGKLAEATVLFGAGLVGLVAAFKAIGIDDTFGTLDDYLTLVTASAGGPAVALAALNALDRFRSWRFDPLLREDGKPASIG